jgi:vacuolar-type H+-ATPase subunit D/Vma8
MSRAVPATRSELLARRSREGIARRGHTLITQKRTDLATARAGALG